MGKLREKMTEDLQLRRYAPSTSERYVSCARAFVAYHRRPPEQMAEKEVRQFLLHLAVEKLETIVPKRGFAIVTSAG